MANACEPSRADPLDRRSSRRAEAQLDDSTASRASARPNARPSAWARSAAAASSPSRAGVVAVVDRHVGERVERERQPCPVAQLAPDAQALDQQAAGGVEVPLVGQHARLVVEQLSEGPPIAQFPEEGDALVVQSPGAAEVMTVPSHDATLFSRAATPGLSAISRRMARLSSFNRAPAS